MTASTAPTSNTAEPNAGRKAFQISINSVIATLPGRDG